MKLLFCPSLFQSTANHSFHSFSASPVRAHAHAQTLGSNQAEQARGGRSPTGASAWRRRKLGGPGRISRGGRSPAGASAWRRRKQDGPRRIGARAGALAGRGVGLAAEESADAALEEVGRRALLAFYFARGGHGNVRLNYSPYILDRFSRPTIWSDHECSAKQLLRNCMSDAMFHLPTTTIPELTSNTHLSPFFRIPQLSLLSCVLPSRFYQSKALVDGANHFCQYSIVRPQIFRAHVFLFS